MLKACSKCGRIHSKKYNCGYKIRSKKKKKTEESKFRSTQAWTNKSIEIRERDQYLCQVCIRNRYNPIKRLQMNGLSVHHVIPVSKDWEKRLDNDNLITLCAMHHEMAEKGEIPYDVLRKIIEEQERK